MKSVVGIFHTRAEAEAAVARVRSIGVPDKNINLLAPGASEKDLASVPTETMEPPGIGRALGGLVGGAVGTAGGAHLGASAASLIVPGVGPVLAMGLAGAAVLGAGGAVGGAAAGGAIEDSMSEGLPKDELFVYEDALRQGRSVLLAFTDDDLAEPVRRVLAESGAETIDAAREKWWLGLRPAEEETYRAEGRDFHTDEQVYRLGFEAALLPQNRGRSYEEAAPDLRRRCANCHGTEAFRRGYERGQAYQQSWSDKRAA